MTTRAKRGKRTNTENHDDENQLRGVIYARYSNGANQTDQSLEGQVRECRQYALEQNIRVIDEYLDPHISGKDAENRPAFQQMIRDSDRHLFDVVIVWKTDRFARNRYDSARYKERLRRNGVSIRYAAEHIPDTAEGIILESMLEGMAEYYSAELREKIQRGMRESAYKFKVISTPPIGFKVGKDRQYEINEETAPLIRQVFEMYNQGENLRVIAETMNKLGLRTVKNNPLRTSTIDKIISNEKYIGVYEYKNAGIRQEDAIPAIVSKDVFYTAQERRDAQRKGTYSKRNYGRSAKRIYPLSGLVYCGECGATMFGETVTKHRGEPNEYSNSYFVCRCHRKGLNGIKCPKTPVPANALEAIVKDTLIDIFNDNITVKRLNEAVSSLDKDRNVDEKITYLRGEKKKKQQAIQNSLKALDAGECTAIILTHLRELESSVSSINYEINRCQVTQREVGNKLQWLLKNYQDDPDNSLEYWNDMFHCFVHSVTCYQNGDVLIQINLFSPDKSGRLLRRIGSHSNVNEYLRKMRRERWLAKAQVISQEVQLTATLPEPDDSDESLVRDLSIFSKYEFYFEENELIVRTILPEKQKRK